jgi:hypothetical protein
MLMVASLSEAAFPSSVELLPTSTSSYHTHSNLSSYLGGQLSLVVPYFVVHGVQPAEDTPNYMPRKVVDNGDVVVTPGIGLEYKDDNGFLALAAVVKDCYNNLAGTLQMGESFRITKSTDWGLTFGVYARETPMACEARSDYPGTMTTHCHAMDNYSWKFLAHFNNEAVDIIPMPFLHLTTNIYKSRDIQIDLKIMGNLILNEVGFSVLL